MKRIEITDKAVKLVERLTLEFRKRKIPNQDAAKIFSEALIATSQEFWDEQTDKFTPDSYILSQAFQDPKMQKEFLDFVKSKKASDVNAGAESDAKSTTDFNEKSLEI